jgi:hypothetical protein
LFFSFRCAELKWPNCVKKRFFPRTTFDKCVFNEMLSEIFIENHMNPAFEKFTNFKNILFCMRLTTTLLTTIIRKNYFLKSLTTNVYGLFDKLVLRTFRKIFFKICKATHLKPFFLCDKKIVILLLFKALQRQVLWRIYSSESW